MEKDIVNIKLSNRPITRQDKSEIMRMVVGLTTGLKVSI